MRKGESEKTFVDSMTFPASGRLFLAKQQELSLVSGHVERF